MSLSTIFSSIGDLLPSATEKIDTTDSPTVDDVFTPSLTNIQQKIGTHISIFSSFDQSGGSMLLPEPFKWFCKSVFNRQIVAN